MTPKKLQDAWQTQPRDVTKILSDWGVVIISMVIAVRDSQVRILRVESYNMHFIVHRDTHRKVSNMDGLLFIL